MGERRVTEYSLTLKRCTSHTVTKEVLQVTDPGIEARIARLVASGRKFYYEDIDSKRTGDDPEYTDNPRTEVDDPAEANLVSSEVDRPFSYDALSGMSQEVHMPVLDIDLPAQLWESSTPGHYHLVIDQEVAWPDYANLLDALVRCGIIEPGYYDAALSRGATFIRKPGVLKPPRNATLARKLSAPWDSEDVA